MLSDRAALVRQTWTAAASHPATLAMHFHARLLALDPTLGLLFVDADLAARGRSLVRLLDLATRNLERLSPAGYVPRSHPAGTVVGQAVLDALAQVVGPHRWTAAVEAAWTEALAAVMDGLRLPDARPRAAA